MNITTKELWQTTHRWLVLCGNKINRDYCKEEITTHPDYPALTSVVDLLDSGNMAYQALRADVSSIHEFNYPLLAHIMQPGQENMQIILNASTWAEQKEMTKYWTGIVIYPEKDANWRNEQNTAYQKNATRNKFITVALMFLGIAIFSFSTFSLLQRSSSENGILFSFFGLFSLIGLTVSLFALGKELGFQSQIVKQVCGAVSNDGCDHVLNSEYAKGVAGITLADASVLYFAAQFIIYSLACFYPLLLSGIFLLSLAGIAVASWSIYTQAVKLMQWCALCLGIVAVLLLQSVIALTNISSLQVAQATFQGLGSFILLLFILALVLLPVKHLVKTNGSNKLKLAELKKWKLDAGLFISQWQQEQEVDTTIWPNDLLLGNPNAPLQITVACNLYCGPCAKAHKQLDELLLRFANKLKIQIRLVCNPGNDLDIRTVAVKAILQKAAVIQDNDQLQVMLSDWFEWMNYDKWVAKWGPDNTIQISHRMQQHDQWIKQSNIAFTPTFFINGKKLPGRYNLNDIELQIPQLSQMMNREPVE